MTDLGRLPADPKQVRNMVKQWLSQGGACDVSAEGIPVFDIVFESGDLDSVSEFLSSGSMPSPAEKDHSFVLEAAVRTRRPYIVKRLVSLGFDVKAKAKDGRGLLHFAAENLNLPLFQWGVSRGLDKNEPDEFRKTPVFYALNNLLIDEELKACEIFIKGVISMDVDLKSKDWSGKNAIESFMSFPSVRLSGASNSVRNLLSLLESKALGGKGGCSGRGTI